MGHLQIYPVLLMLFSVSFSNNIIAQVAGDVHVQHGRFVPFGKYHVHVINAMSDNTGPLDVHCKSKDTDLGLHSLQIGQEYDWKFGMDFLGNTLFFCHLNWEGLDCVFDVFNKVLAQHGMTLFWKATDEGIMFSPNNKDWELKVHWNGLAGK